ncbi:MAG: O-antigen ligase domain-containing protein [Thermosynechococcaceae cyanobacterium MS004]|nr:O-antigen ligase domain-containing protein [Thermosynechococcaceae cyanobacterium MS004]
MNVLGYLVMICWIPTVLFFFNRLPVQRAVIFSFLVAWLFLPMASISLKGVPDYTKMSATCYGILLATAIFDLQRFRQFRLHWVDAPLVVWCLCPLASSLTNGLGPYDGLSAVLDQTVTWGFPYFLGRLYLGSLKGLEKLAVGIIWGGLAYVPLCLLEVRLSPQLHQWLYGFNPQSFDQAIRYGGFRPIVFMQHGLMVGVWMMAATLLAIALWRSGMLWQRLMQFLQEDLLGQRVSQSKAVQGQEPVLGVAAVSVVTLLVTFVLVKSTGAYFLLLIGLGLLFLVQWGRTALPIIAIALLLSGYLVFTTTGGLTPERISQISTVVTRISNVDRAQSLAFRLKNEELLTEKARLQPVFGWGGWGRARIFNEYGQDISITDSLWIINFGNLGLVGLWSWMGIFLVPILGFALRRYPPSTWSHLQVVPAATLSVVLLLYVMDCLVNAMVNPIFTLAAGGLAGLVARPVPAHARPSTSSRNFAPFPRRLPTHRA